MTQCTKCGITTVIACGRPDCPLSLSPAIPSLAKAKGRVDVKIGTLLDLNEQLFAIMDGLVALHVETNWGTDFATYTLIGPPFRVLAEAEEIPLYTVSLTESDGRLLASFHEVKNGGED